ncbi:MAG TPA: hypothetical protein VGO41_09445 [Steroidobacteraceae bacterium]|jgi:hypothetical protein|nr:hypothetical protein [Steroidobacteraceae bacterium]
MSFTRVSLITAMLCVVPTVHAATAAPESMRACSRLQDSLQRLVCYDREFAVLDAAAGTAAAPAAPIPAAAVAAPASAASTSAASTSAAPVAAQFGDELVSRKTRPAKGSTEASLTAGVTALREDQRGTWVISLDNGQVWRQQEVGMPFPLRTGETVRIDKGVLGSYMLTRVVEGWTRWIRVTRVK